MNDPVTSLVLAARGGLAELRRDHSKPDSFGFTQLAICDLEVALDNFCPACSSWERHPRSQADDMRVFVCRACGCMYGNCQNGASFTLVKSAWSKRKSRGTEVPFDLMDTDHGVRYRRHGWYDPKTGLITQVG